MIDERLIVLPDRCPHCGEPLPARGNRRVAIPRLGGRRRLVHAGCALELEQQQTLDFGRTNERSR